MPRRMDPLMLSAEPQRQCCRFSIRRYAFDTVSTESHSRRVARCLQSKEVVFRTLNAGDLVYSALLFVPLTALLSLRAPTQSMPHSMI